MSCFSFPLASLSVIPPLHEPAVPLIHLSINKPFHLSTFPSTHLSLISPLHHLSLSLPLAAFPPLYLHLLLEHFLPFIVILNYFAHLSSRDGHCIIVSSGHHCSHLFALSLSISTCNFIASLSTPVVTMFTNVAKHTWDSHCCCFSNILFLWMEVR